MTLVICGRWDVTFIILLNDQFFTRLHIQLLSFMHFCHVGWNKRVLEVYVNDVVDYVYGLMPHAFVAWLRRR